MLEGDGTSSSLEEVKSKLRTDREGNQVSRMKEKQQGISGYRRLKFRLQNGQSRGQTGKQEPSHHESHEPCLGVWTLS